MMIRSTGALRFGDSLLVLDQHLLPDEEHWLDGSDPDYMIHYIRTLKVRGAPLIGVAAALSLACLARTGESDAALRDAAIRLREARPTAVNLMWAMDRMLEVLNHDGDLEAEALAIFDEEAARCDALARHGAALIEDGEGILTHCNTGGLATAGVGTALGVIRRAWESGKRLHVYVDETRPLLQGARLTTWELRKLGIPHTLIADSAAAAVMQLGKVQRVLVGADRIAANGDFANKIGTYSVAVAARHHGIPFHVVAPWSTVDLSCASGSAIPIEERRPEEVCGIEGAFGAVRWAPAETPAFNPAFDVTPASLVTSIVLDSGVMSRGDLNAGRLREHRPAPAERRLR